MPPLVIADSAPSIGLAFAAGLASFLSPCVLPLVPGYLSTVCGLTPGEMRASRSEQMRAVLARAGLFVLTFSAIFILLGMTATGIGSALSDNRQTLEKVAGVAIIAMGVLFLLALFVPMLNREWRIDALAQRAGSGGPLIAGAAFAIAWTPCVGPRARLDPRPRSDAGLGRPGRRAAGGLLARARRAVPDHRGRVQRARPPHSHGSGATTR